MKHRKDRQRRNLRWQRDFPLSFRASGRAASAGVVALLAFGVAAQAPARAASPFLDPTTPADATNLGLAGTGRAVASNLDNIWYGSAPLALESRYDIHGSGFLTPGGWRGFEVAALDSRTSNLAMGVVYSFMHHPDMPMLDSELPGWTLPGTGSDNPAAAQHVAAGLAMCGDGDRRLSIGIHGGYFWRRTGRAGDGSGIRLGGSVAGRPHETVVMSLGTTWPLLVSGARGYEDQPRVDAGLRWQPAEGLSLLADGALPIDELDGLDVGLGAEYVFAELVPLRLGWSRNAGDVRHALGAGLGVKAEFLDLQYGLWADLGPSSEGLETPTHALTLAMEF
jgi:hypothetical protein